MTKKEKTELAKKLLKEQGYNDKEITEIIALSDFSDVTNVSIEN